jgi:uncharacterized protein YggU (UPF0235/DUF167 family)
VRVRVAPRPVDGAANDALLRLLADTLGVAKGRVAIVRATSRSKIVEIAGLEPAAIRSRWPGADV